MRILDADAATAALPFDRLVPALQRAFADGCEVPQRHVHVIGAPGAGDDAAVADEAVTSLLMPAWTVGRHFGVKIANIATGNAARGLPSLHASYIVHDANTGVPLALIDGAVLTARRTAAASALAASWLARRDARSLLVVGAGAVARLLPEAYRQVMSIEQVHVWARRREQAEALAQHWKSLGFDAHAVSDLAAAVGVADIVSCATLAREPLILGRWLRPGSHLDLIGSFTPAMREADDDCFVGASVWVDTDEALRKSGDLIGPLSRGVIAASDIRGTLAGLVRGEVPGRSTSTERTVFKSVGTALEDLAAAVLTIDG